jgi:hypothetical protein
MSGIASMFEGLLFGGAKEKKTETPNYPPPADLEKEKRTPVQGLDDFTHTAGRLRGAPSTGLKKNLGME